MATPYFGAIELGGTKAICLKGQSLDAIDEQIRIETKNPNETIAEIVDFFKAGPKLSSLGLGSFGPININPKSPNYGQIQSTPKPHWSGTDLVQQLNLHLDCKINVDTDVNAAALAEKKLGAGRNLDNFIYLTIGTGIGGGAIVNGQIVKGLSHPEMGHIQIRRHESDIDFESVCSFHSNCAEGLASGKAIYSRWQQGLADLDEDHPAWQLEAYYLAQLISSLILSYSPERIILGGGVSNKKLLTHLSSYVYRHLNGYVGELNSLAALDAFLCLPELGDNAGPFGSFLLAQTKSSN